MRYCSQTGNRLGRKGAEEIFFGRSREDRGGAESQSKRDCRRQRNRGNKSGDGECYSQRGKHTACGGKFSKSKKVIPGEASANHRGASSQSERKHGGQTSRGRQFQNRPEDREKGKDQAYRCQLNPTAIVGTVPGRSLA